MRKVVLTMKEELTYLTIKELVDTDGNKKRASNKLNKSVRQIDRLIIIYKEKGKSGFIHGNRLKKPKTKIDSTLSNDIIILYNTKYQNFNIKHFLEYLINEEKMKVSYTFLYELIRSNGILSPKAKKRTKREFKKKQLIKEKKITNKTDKEINDIVTREIALEDSHPRGPKPKYFGKVIEQDGSIHNWFGDIKTCLHLAIDKATSTIVGGYFDTYETLNGYYKVLYQILTNYGIPNMFFTDNRTVFNYRSLNPDKRTSDKDVSTQYSYACSQLGINIETSSVSQSKGLIERTNGTFQGRLVNELRLNNIRTVDEANDYLINIFIAKFNSTFSLNYNRFGSVFVKAPDNIKINYILSVLTPRIIDNGNSIKFKNKYYQPYLDNQIKCFLPKTKCLVINAYNGDLLVAIEDKVYDLKKLERNETISKDFDEIEIANKPKVKKKYILL